MGLILVQLKAQLIVEYMHTVFAAHGTYAHEGVEKRQKCTCACRRKVQVYEKVEMLD